MLSFAASALKKFEFSGDFWKVKSPTSEKLKCTDPTEFTFSEFSETTFSSTLS